MTAPSRETAADAAATSDGTADDPSSTRSSGRRVLVVGVDGSAPANRALDWAVREARLRGAALDIVSVWEDPYRYYFADTGDTPEIDEEEWLVAHGSQDLVDEIARRVRVLEPDLDVRALTFEGGPAQHLIKASRGAELLVVGTRGRGGFRGLVLGSVSQQCIAHAHCPVVVVRAIDGEDS